MRVGEWRHLSLPVGCSLGNLGISVGASMLPFIFLFLLLPAVKNRFRLA